MPNWIASSSQRATPADPVADDVRRYLWQAMRAGGAEVSTHADTPDAGGALERIFDALTQRRFCALSRGRARQYRDSVLGALAPAYERSEALEFWFDIGPGYRASLRPGALPLRYDVGLGEYLMLAQVAAFARIVSLHYPPGARFHLVVDNVCALRTNDVALERTTAYCSQLRTLIAEMRLAGIVRLLVESEAFDLREYDALARAPAAPASAAVPTPAEIENVARFLGRRCTPAEAAERIRLYARATAATEALLARVVRGVRLTQRASAATLGFRPFPGGDARMQCGEVALTRLADGRIAPILLTSRNIDAHDCTGIGAAGVLPSPVREITFAARRL
jgi:hypothetical protein